jgi:D-alanyl-lipoteichoic acid acyltransferase DltB (MBOAT superfamily)
MLIIDWALVCIGLFTGAFITLFRFMSRYDQRRTQGHVNSVNLMTAGCVLMVLFGWLGIARH